MVPMILKPCKTKAAIEVIPAAQTRLETKTVGRILSRHGYRLVTDARVLIIFRSPEGIEFTLFPKGKIMFKSTDEAIVTRLAADIYTLLGVIDHRGK